MEKRKKYLVLNIYGNVQTKGNRMAQAKSFYAIISFLAFYIALLIISQIFTIAVTIEEIFKNIAIVVGMLILVYGIYFIATDVQFNRNINGDW